MKKSLVLSLLGLTAGAVSSFGQGSIAFDTYNSHSYVGTKTTYAAGLGFGTGTTGIPNTFTGELLWSTANIADLATTAAVTAGSQLTAGWTIGSTGHFATGSTTTPGYIIAPNLNLTTVQLGGAITTLYFEVVAFSGAAYATAGQFSGHSATFQATLVSGATQPNANQLNNLVPFQVYNVTSVPEPSSLALAGLGGFGMLMAFRRKKA